MSVMRRYEDNVSAGSPESAVQGVSVRVKISGTPTDANLFSDTAGLIPIANPILTDSKGYYCFCVVDGTYDLTFTMAGLQTYTRQGVEIASSLNTASASTTGMTRADFGDDQTVNSERGLFWKIGALAGGYGIGRVAGAWAGSLIQLLISWQAGIQLDPGTASPDKSHVEVLNNRGLIASLLSSKAGGVSLGAAGSRDAIVKKITGMADAAYTDTVTVTVPNAAHGGALRLVIAGSLGAGGAVGAFEGTRTVEAVVPIARTPGLATGVGAVFTGAGGEVEVAGGATIAMSLQASGLTGANGATQTFTIQVRITRGSGASTNHSCVVYAEVLNNAASGITLS